MSLKQLSAIGYSKKVFDSINALADLLLPSNVARYTPVEYQKKVNEIEISMRALRQNPVPQNRGLPRGSKTKNAAVDQLYLLSALIYLNKTAMQYSGDEIQHRRLVEEALSYLSEVQTSEAAWPLFIIGCEAQTDYQRSLVLEVPLRLQNDGLLDNAMWIRRLIESYWNQDDLDEEHNLSYVYKLSGVISACPFLPVFV